MLKQSPLYSYAPATDVARARRFYDEKLGLGPGEPVGGDAVHFDCAGGTAILVYPTPNAGTNRASCAFWQVQDIVAAVDWLKGRGVVFEQYDTPDMKTDARGIFVGGGAKAAWFKDTEGNILAVIEDGED